jgi:hypothetical protein
MEVTQLVQHIGKDVRHDAADGELTVLDDAHKRHLQGLYTV